MFITIYGVNNIGKSTQVKRLVSRLQESGTSALAMKYPVYESKPTGPMIDFFLRDPKAPNVSAQELQMWYALNRFQVEPELKKNLSQGVTVVAEDYTGTGIAWGITHGADKNWVVSLNSPLLREDLSILLDGLPFGTNREKQHINEADDARIQKCRKVHLELAKEFGWAVVDAGQAEDRVAEEIWNIVQSARKQ